MTTAVIEYTQEELDLLQHMLKDGFEKEIRKTLYKSLEDTIGRVNSNNMIDSLVVGPLSRSLGQIESDMSKTALWHVERLKSMSLDDMPLLINNDDVSARTVALWRMKLGK